MHNEQPSARRNHQSLRRQVTGSFADVAAVAQRVGPPLLVILLIEGAAFVAAVADERLLWAGLTGFGLSTLYCGARRRYIERIGAGA